LPYARMLRRRSRARRPTSPKRRCARPCDLPVRCRHRRRRSTSLAHRLRPLQPAAVARSRPPFRWSMARVRCRPRLQCEASHQWWRPRPLRRLARRYASTTAITCCNPRRRHRRHRRLPSGRSARRRCLRGRRRCRSHPRRPRSSRPRRCCRRLSQRRRCRMSSHQPALRRREPLRVYLRPCRPQWRPRRRRLRRRQRPRSPLHRPVRREAFQPARHPPIRDRTTGRTRG